MKRLAFALLSILAVACDNNEPTGSLACPDVLRPSVVVSVRDRDGRAAAIGTTLTLVGAADLVNGGKPLKGFSDSLMMYAGGNSVAGPMDVVITKPWHVTTSLRGLKMSVNQCGVITPAKIGFSLKRAANAPPVRQVVVDPFAHAYNRSGIIERLRAVVLADDSMSQEVVWLSRDPSVASVTTDGLLASRCRKTPGATYVVASAIADLSVRDSLAVTVAVDANTSRCPP